MEVNGLETFIKPKWRDKWFLKWLVPDLRGSDKNKADRENNSISKYKRALRNVREFDGISRTTTHTQTRTELESNAVKIRISSDLSTQITE